MPKNRETIGLFRSKINDKGRVTSTFVPFPRKQDRIHPCWTGEMVEIRLEPRAPNRHLRPEPAAEDHFNDDTMNPRSRKQRLRRKNERIYTSFKVVITASFYISPLATARQMRLMIARMCRSVSQRRGTRPGSSDSGAVDQALRSATNRDCRDIVCDSDDGNL